MIPEEDRSPAWLRDYGYTDFGDIAADIAAMEEFAKKLAADLQDNYVPHMTGVTDAMLTELVTFLQTHQMAQDTTQGNVYNFANGTNQLAFVARSVSEEYRGVDAFAHARVRDVDAAFDQAGDPDAGGDH